MHCLMAGGRAAVVLVAYCCIQVLQFLHLASDEAFRRESAAALELVLSLFCALSPFASAHHNLLLTSAQVLQGSTAPCRLLSPSDSCAAAPSPTSGRTTSASHANPDLSCSEF